jgi:hypothetical protein
MSQLPHVGLTRKMLVSLVGLETGSGSGSGEVEMFYAGE